MQPRIAIFCNKKFGEDALYIALGRGDISVELVCSNSSSNNWWKSNKSYLEALERNIPFVDNTKRNEDLLLKILEEKEIDILICAQHPWILSEKIIHKFKAAYNFHNAKLPDYKGHNCCNHAILNGDTVYTTTVHILDTKVDSGDIILEKNISITSNETAYSLYAKSNEAALELFIELLNRITSGKQFERIPQTGNGTFYPRNSIENLKDLTNESDLEKIDRIKRALYFPPFEGAYRIVKGKKEYL